MSLANVAGLPPVFVKPLAVDALDPLALFAPSLPHTPVTVTLAVEAAGSNNQKLLVRDDGRIWTIESGKTRLIIDVGPNQEVVTPARFAVDPATGAGSFQIVLQRPHAPGFTIANTFLGNPGPQNRFDPRDPVFAGSDVRCISASSE